ncbi:MAG TPA: DUF5916 domain-containing protein [Thermoanaerobaculia bacterium]|nr:DUF5916 domain-containing protein [Thermoanaerobaculia bacterium]
MTDLWSGGLQPAEGSGGLKPAAPRDVRAVRTAHAPVIDGRLDDEAWAGAPLIDGMQQQRPDNGQPGSERTEIRLLFDDDALYVGARMHDRSPVTRLLGRRDTFLECDWLGILLDPLLDRRTGNAFFVNPDGVQYDEVISNDDSEDTDWDGVWQSATSMDEGGWSAELRIPFSQLRLDNREKQLWGINFIRWIKRRQEQDRLFTHPRNQRGFASRFGTLAGLDGIKPRPKVEVAPYVVSSFDQARSVSVVDPLNERRSREVDGGLDLRWKARSNIAVAATLNPDFGQVEVDPAILNLSQFELFFPEKRPFFVEGAKIFTFGGIATEYASPFAVAQPVLFYSRRIGRVPQGNARVVSDYVDLPDETSILGAAKVSGRLGATTFAVLGALTQAEEAKWSANGTVGERVVEPRSGYLALRATRDYERARIGGIVTSVTRQNDADTRGFLASQATVAGVDGYAWLAKRTVLLDYFFAASSIRGTHEAIAVLQRAPAHQYAQPDPTRTSLSGTGAKVVLSRESGMWRYQLQAQSYSQGFDINDLGFQSRADLRSAHAQGTWLDVKTRKRTRQNRITIGRYILTNQNGDRLGDGIAADSATQFKNYWSLNLRASRAFAAFDDRESRGGPIIRKPEGWAGQVTLSTDSRKKISAALTRVLGSDDDGGSISTITGTLTLRPRSNVNISVAATRVSNVIASKWVATTGGQPIFARLRDERLEIAPRVDWTIRRTLTLQLFLQPFAASGTYDGFKQLVRPGGDYEPYTGSLRNPNFVLRSMRGNAVLRWELRGASTLFLVWNQQRSDRRLEPTRGAFDDFRGVTSIEPDDRFLVKVSHRFDFPK